MPQLAAVVDGEDAGGRDAHGAVGEGVVHPVAVPGVQRVSAREECLNVAQTGDFEVLGTALYHFPVEQNGRRCQ